MAAIPTDDAPLLRHASLLKTTELDWCHNSEPASCAACMRLENQPWKWESLEKNVQELFVEELWRDNPYALHVPTTSFRTIQCDKDRFLVAEALSNITKEGAARMLLPDEQAPPWKPLQQQSKKLFIKRAATSIIIQTVTKLF